VFGGLLFAVLLRALAAPICSYTPLGERSALSIVILVLLALMGLAVWLIGPSVAQEVRELQAGLVKSIEQLRAAVESTAIGGYALTHAPQMDDGDYERIWARIGGVSATAFGALGALTVVLFVGIFFAFSPRLYTSGLLRLVPVPRRPRVYAVIEEVGGTLRWWMISQLISMVVLWLSTWLMLHLLGVPLAFILALLTGLLTFIPYIGPLIALVPILLVALMESPTLAGTVLVLYMVIQNLEANVLMPLIYQRLVHLPPVLTIASQVLMGTLVGMLGIILATPLLAVVMVMIARLYVEDVLGDSMQRPAFDPQAARAHAPEEPVASKD
jgi:predicted PurR-regulated permease PerM